MTARQTSAWWSASAVLLLFLAWEVAARAAGDAAFPAFSAAVGAIWRERDLLAWHALPSLAAALLALALALGLAFATASISAMSARTDRAITPLVLAQQTVPLVAIAPLLVPLIGDGFTATVLIAAWLSWFPAVTSFTTGFLTVGPDHLAIFRLSGATRWQTHWQLRVPGAAGAMLAGVRGSAGFALIGVLVAEYGGAERGLGSLIIGHVAAIAPLPADLLLGLVLLCSVLGAVITWAARALARLALATWLEPGRGSVVGGQ